MSRGAVNAAAPEAASSITIDFRQASELLEMFGGEPTEITLMTGDGHSGHGLYAVYNADPEGAVYLGETDEEAEPERTHPPAASEREGEADEAALWRFLRDNHLQYFEPVRHWVWSDANGKMIAEGHAYSFESAVRAALDAQRLGREKGHTPIGPGCPSLE